MNELLKGQKVLILVPRIHPLDRQIIDSLKSMGATVHAVEDRLFPFNPISRSGIFNGLRKFWFSINHINDKYHNKFEQIYHQKWDYFICFNGFSLTHTILRKLKASNPDIKIYYYLWDSINVFRFDKNFSIFDKVYTFDPIDAKNHQINYLPLFWVPSNDDNSKKKNTIEYKYDISFIGKLHSDRYSFIKNIREQCDKLGIKYFFKIIITDKGNYLQEWMKHIIYKIKDRSKQPDHRYQLITEKIKDPIVSFDYIDYPTVADTINSSKIILDIQLPNQYGYTNRMIQSLSQGRKIITTNMEALNDEFLNLKGNIMIIDRKNPEISKIEFNDFLKRTVQENSNIDKLRIDNWILSILEISE